MSISIKEIMKKDFSKLSSSDSVESAVELIEKRGVDYLLVEEEGEIKGVLTSHELVGYPSSRLLVDCRIKPIATIAEETGLNEALKVLEEKEVNFLVVLNKEGSPIGVINKEIIISFIYQEVKKSNKEKEREVTERKRVEEALKESKERYRTIFETTGTAMLIGEEDTTISMINAKFEKLCGYSKEEVEGKKSWIEFIVKSDLERMKECHRLRIIDPNAAPPYYEFQFIDKQGNVRDCFITLDLIPGTKKTVGSLIDITERKQAEEALRESEERYRTLVEGLEDVIVSFSLDGTILYCSPNVKNFGGYDAEEEIGHHFIRYIADEEAKQKLQDIFQDIITTKKPVSFEFLYKPKNKEPFYVEATASPNISKISNAIVSIQCIVRNITERKQAEEELVRSEEKFRSVVENSNDVICIVQDGLLKFVNKQIAKLTGYSLGDFVDKPFISYIHPDDLQKIKKKYERFMTGEEDEQRYEIGVMHKDGHKIEVELNISVTYYEGRRAGLVFVRDITERKRVEGELHESEEKIRSMSASAQDAIIMMNNEGNILYWNEAAERIFGYTEEEIIGKKLHETIVPERFHEDILKGFKRFQETGQGAAIGKTLELAAVRKDGTEFPIELSLSAVKIKGKWNAIGIIRDITERKRAEGEIRKLSSAVDQSIDGIAIGDLEPKLTYVNDAFARMHGYSSEEMIGMKVVNLHNEEQVDEYKSGMNQIKTQGEWVGEIGHIRKDGTPFPTFMSVTLLKGADGKPTGILAAARDITERKQMEEALRKSEKMLSQILQGSSVPTFVIDNRHTITHWNKACENLTGVPASEVIGTKKQWSAFYSVERPIMADLIQEEQAEEEIARYYGGMYQKSALLGGACEAEGFFPNLGERGKWLFFTAAPLRDHQGKVIGAIETLQDVTERKQAEEKVKEAYRLREHFLKETSHRIITPVAIIGGNTDLLLKSSNLDDNQKEKIRIIRERNEEVQKLVRDALAGKYLEGEEEEEEEEEEGSDG